jgi:hypothetical protein
MQLQHDSCCFDLHSCEFLVLSGNARAFCLPENQLRLHALSLDLGAVSTPQDAEDQSMYIYTVRGDENVLDRVYLIQCALAL